MFRGLRGQAAGPRAHAVAHAAGGGRDLHLAALRAGVPNNNDKHTTTAAATTTTNNNTNTNIKNSNHDNSNRYQ